MSNAKTKVGFAIIGRNQEPKLPQLGLIHLVNELNASSSMYEAEYFDYTDFRLSSMGESYVPFYRFAAAGDRFPSMFLPELPVVELIIQYVRSKQGKDLDIADLEGNVDYLAFINRNCRQYGVNTYVFLRHVEELFKLVTTKILPETAGISVLGFAVHAGNFLVSVIAAEIIRARTGIVVIAGGPQITASFPYLKPLVEDSWFFDMVVAGDADGVIETIVTEALDDQRSFDCTAERPRKIAELNVTEGWTFDCVLKKGYRYDELIFDYSRGCPLSCKFCGEFGIHGRAGLRDPEIAAEDLIRLAMRHRQSVWRLSDSMLNYQSEHMVTFMNTMAALRKKYWWHPSLLYMYLYGYIAAPITHKEASTMQAAGFKEAWVGLESFNDLFLAQVHKRAATSEIYETIVVLLEHGINVGLLVIAPNLGVVNLPDDFVYRSTKGMRDLVDRLVDSRVLRKSKACIYVSALTPSFIPLNSMQHRELETAGQVEYWNASDFFDSRNPSFDAVPKSYVLKEDSLRTLAVAYNLDEALNEFFPLYHNTSEDSAGQLPEYWPAPERSIVRAARYLFQRGLAAVGL